MRLIRRFEERVIELVNADEIAGVTHEYIGQEAVATGVCRTLGGDDIITSTHRGHGHLLAKGGDPRRMMAELLGRTDGYNGGHGGSMHIADVGLGVYGANGIVGAGVPIAAGAAWAALKQGRGRIAACFFGDGAMNQGVVHETLNLAMVMRLPLLFVCENNGYAVTTSSSSATAGNPVERVAAYGMRARQSDGMDVESVYSVAAEEVERIRTGGGPAFVEFATYRFMGHHTAERLMNLNYRAPEEVAAWKLRDPLLIQVARLTAREVHEVDSEVEARLETAVDFARESPFPDPEAAADNMYASAAPGLPALGWRNA